MIYLKGAIVEKTLRDKLSRREEGSGARMWCSQLQRPLTSAGTRLSPMQKVGKHSRAEPIIRATRENSTGRERLDRRMRTSVCPCAHNALERCGIVGDIRHIGSGISTARESAGLSGTGL